MTQNEAIELFDYVDGKLFWKTSHRKSMIGKEAGAILRKGHRVVVVCGKKIRAHKIIWLMHYGYIPSMIDHINGNPDDNRIENLREATTSENNCNQKVRRDSSTGIKGVVKQPNCKNYYITVKKNGVNHTVYGFKDIESAAKAVKELRESLHGEFTRHE